MSGYTCPICGRYFTSPILCTGEGRLKRSYVLPPPPEGVCFECTTNLRAASTTRHRMIVYRAKRNISIYDMALRCNIGVPLLRGIEGGWITHPAIAAKIAAEYELDVDGYNDLVHPDRRADAIPVFPKDRDWRGYAEYFSSVLNVREKGDESHAR